MPTECPTTSGRLEGPTRYPTECPTTSRRRRRKSLTFTQQDQQTKTGKVNIFLQKLIGLKPFQHIPHQAEWLSGLITLHISLNLFYLLRIIILKNSNNLWNITLVLVED